jgi:hypothetical protein
MKSVTLVELSVFQRIAPLVSGYLMAFASTDPDVRSDYRFHTYTTSVQTPPDAIARAILANRSDVYAFSCYLWNMGLVRSLVPMIREARPHAHIMLGGPQVMHHGERYLDSDDERLVLCNGEGEETFTAYLRELAQPSPHLSAVDGISFYRDRSLVTTPQRPRIVDLDRIPSPFLSGMIEPEYSMSVLETNRGCPYHCGFCYWGAATNDRVYRFDQDRVRDEISWMSRNGVVFLYIADANWGMLSRDIELSQHIADCARLNHLPNVVYFSAAKNKPQAVTTITGVLQDAGLIASQPVSMQTLEPESLRIIQRSNIKITAFNAVQEHLRETRTSSYVELIWPLPGESLMSFKNGIDTLCCNGASAIIAYAHLLLNNTPLYLRREELGLVTRPVGGSTAEAQVVIRTEQVNESEFAEGMRFFYAMHALHNTDCLRMVSRYLVRLGTIRYADLFDGFVDYWRSVPSDDAIVEFVERSIRDAEYYDVGNYGTLIHMVLHSHRELFARHLLEFVQTQPWWSDPDARALFEVDLVSRPYVYSNTPLDKPCYPFASLRVVEERARGYVVELDERCRMLASGLAGRTGDLPVGTSSFLVSHERLQYAFMASQGLEHHAQYCFGMIMKFENVTPIWQAL